MLVVISNALLYPAFAFLVGGLILMVVPEKYRPTLYVNKTTFITVVLAIIFLTSVPVFSLAINLSGILNLSLLNAVKQVLFTFNIGQVWIQTLISGALLIVILLFWDKGRKFRYFALLLSIVIVVIVSQASHSASLQPSLGLVGHSIHFISVSVWAGILLVVGISAKDEVNWDSFLKWYTPTAVFCVVILSVSGMFLMKGIVPDYANSLMLSYGQLLLLKHILFLLVIIYGFINGFLIRRKLKNNPSFTPKKWLRLESVFLIFTFMITAFMTEEAPPHNVSVTLERVEPSTLFEWIYGSVGTYSNVLISSQPFTMFLVFIVLLTIIFIFYVVLKSKRILIAFFTSLIFLLASYSLIMSLVTVENVFETESRVYSSIEEAIMVGHATDDQLTIFQTGNRYAEIIYVIYTINDSQLIGELLYENDLGYERIRESRLTIGGVPIKDSKHKIRTFLITDGPWKQQNEQYTYVTFGHIQEPDDVFSVEIQYEGERRNVNVQNRTFFNLSSSDEQWEALHPIIFYNQDGEEIGGYMRQFMETEAFCH
ncbi:hypothetical protein BKP35_09220 [Anaerobacillus arseniciselenatis]|uniref:Copper resistance protein D domain-containing protein n=1 Tax=Anaerobacillus arseniciselenatis TaxID=85682 RepID=A0A1S2LJQ4_9BACI|nr:CopD family protein [Anaerobacillus arseniciselenatis]OIJ12752.1 hypothetical protein BKP35_09220 [Anaerobacillus arseniciselenatis]